MRYRYEMSPLTSPPSEIGVEKQMNFTQRQSVRQHLAAMYSSLLLALQIATSVFAACKDGVTVVQRSKWTCGNKQYIVDYHNKIRNHVAAGRIESQPKAADMIELRWSEALAKLAQKRADTCLFEHGDLQLNGDPVGQNLAIVYSNANNLRLNITYMMEMWYNEVFQYGYTEGFEHNSGHYSQLIWGNTREVGCGYTYYKEEGWYKMYFVCDYYPPGNYIGQKPYAYGKHNCKEFGLQQSRRYSKLCVVNGNEERVCKLETPETSDSGNKTEPYDHQVSSEVFGNFTISNESAETSSESAEENEIDGKNEVVTVYYGTVDDMPGDSSNETTTVEDKTNVTFAGACNETSSRECIQVVNSSCTEFNASVEKTEEVSDSSSLDSNKLCLLVRNENLTSSEKLVEFMERLYYNLGELRNIFIENSQVFLNDQFDTPLEIEPEYNEHYNMTETKNNKTLNILNDSIRLAGEFLQFFARLPEPQPT